MKTKKKKIAVSVLLALVLLLAAGAVYYFQFTAEGYLSTLKYRASFTQIADGVFINKNYAGDRGGILDLYEDAKSRVSAFFGGLTCMDDTVLVVCDDPKLIAKTGEKETKTPLFPKRKSVICIAQEYLNLDILSHELTHAELMHHFTVSALRKLPVWFNEGFAVQNDYREKYSPENWSRLTDSGKNAVALADMDTGRKFYAEPTEWRVLCYACAKHEIAEWLETHTVQDAFALAEKMNAGEDFHALYGK